MTVSKYCNVYSLVAGFLVGLLLMSVITEDPEIVIKYPTPYNSTGVTYVDNAGQCYQYQSNKVVCPSDNRVISEIPLQLD